MNRTTWVAALAVLVLGACTEKAPLASPPAGAVSAYLDYSGRDDVRSGGARMIPINTPIGPT
jgi:proline iminopeptidase